MMGSKMETSSHKVASPEHYMSTEGALDSVWSHTNPYAQRPRFSKLDRDLEADVVVVGSGIAGLSTAYELVKRNRQVVLLEAREALSGETDRTSGHLSSALDDGYVQIKEKHGHKGAAIAYDSYKFALEHVGEVAKELNIDCEWRILDGYEISQYRRGNEGYDQDLKEMNEEVAYDKTLGMPVEFHEKLAVPGWTGEVDQRGGMLWHHQATFNPTKYLFGVLGWLKKQPQFSIYTHTRVMDTKEKGGVPIVGNPKHVEVSTADGHTVTCKDVVMATCIPLQKLSVVAQMEYNRTYCVALRIPKGSYTDCIVYDTADPYHYIRFTHCDEKDDYLIIGGADHKVGQAGDEKTRFSELESWARERWTQCGAVDYQWSGQIFEPHDYVAFIGLNPGMKHTYIVTGDSGNGLTHGVLASRILADEITGTKNEWSKLYDPKRVKSLLTSAKEILTDDLQVNAQYKRFVETDIQDIEDLGNGQGGVLNKGTKGPTAVYKTEDGEVRMLSAVCPHMKGVLCWNTAEATWDCPVHGSRFSKDGVCVIGPAKGNLKPENEAGKRALERAEMVG